MLGENVSLGLIFGMKESSVKTLSFGAYSRHHEPSIDLNVINHPKPAVPRP